MPPVSIPVAESNEISNNHNIFEFHLQIKDQKNKRWRGKAVLFVDFMTAILRRMQIRSECLQ